jgi:hypothetical protein
MYIHSPSLAHLFSCSLILSPVSYNLLQYELYDEEHNLEEVNSDDSDSEHEEAEWVERKIADVGSSPSEESSFPHSHPSHPPSDDPSSHPDPHQDKTDEEMKGGEEDFGDFVKGQES